MGEWNPNYSMLMLATIDANMCYGLNGNMLMMSMLTLATTFVQGSTSS
jgi:hypothetical protein